MGTVTMVTTLGNWVVSCGSCDLTRKRTGGLTDYERQAIESQPCPACGAYTLSCSGPRRDRTRCETRDAARSRRAA